MDCDNNQDFNEIFIIDKDVLEEFFKEENYEKAELFLLYLTTHCNHKKAYMIPCVFDTILINLKTKITDETKRTEIISYINNWIEKADLLGEDQGDEIHDTVLLYQFLTFLFPESKIIILSNKDFQEKAALMNLLSIESIWNYLMSNKKFKDYVRVNYGVDDGATY